MHGVVGWLSSRDYTWTTGIYSVDSFTIIIISYKFMMIISMQCHVHYSVTTLNAMVKVLVDISVITWCSRMGQPLLLKKRERARVW